MCCRERGSAAALLIVSCNMYDANDLVARSDHLPVDACDSEGIERQTWACRLRFARFWSDQLRCRLGKPRLWLFSSHLVQLCGPCCKICFVRFVSGEEHFVTRKSAKLAVGELRVCDAVGISRSIVVELISLALSLILVESLNEAIQGIQDLASSTHPSGKLGLVSPSCRCLGIRRSGGLLMKKAQASMTIWRWASIPNFRYPWTTFFGNCLLLQCFSKLIQFSETERRAPC